MFIINFVKRQGCTSLLPTDNTCNTKILWLYIENGKIHNKHNKIKKKIQRAAWNKVDFLICRMA